MRMTIGAAVLSLALFGTLPEPRITGVAPETPLASSKPQTLSVTGEGFRSGLTLFVTTPGGTVRTFTGSDLSSERPTSFNVTLTLNETGRYSLAVANEDGQRSTAFTIQARAAGRQPWIDEVMPAEFSRSQQAQTVTLAGRNLAPGLRVSLTDPTGTVTTAEIDRADTQSVVFRAVFEHAGPYEILLTNPSGESSNAVAISVN